MRSRSIRRKWRPCTLAVLVSFLLASCPLKFDPAMLQQVKDGIVPSISISSPTEGSSYAATVVVSGIVTDFSTESGDGGGLRSVAYTVIPETLPGGIVDFAGDGSFSFSYPTTGFSGPMVIKIVAEDWNGNTREVSISLVDGGAFATFTATPGNKLATLVWDDVALAESYSVHNLRYGEVENDVTSPFDWTGLTNGELYSFQISATSSQGDDNWSAIQDVIPLSARTLAPNVVAQYRKIFLEWAQIPAADEYVVSRSLDPNGPFTTRTITANTEFADGNVLLDQEYYYRVRPFSQDSIESIANGAQPCPLPPERWYIVDTMVLPASAFGVETEENIAYVATYDGLEVVDISDPTQMALIGSTSTVGPGYDVDINAAATRAYLVGWDSDLNAIDLSVAGYPLVTPRTNVSANLMSIALSEDDTLACVASYIPGELKFFDVSGSSPFPEVGSRDLLSGGAYHVTVSGSYAYVVDAGTGPTSGLHVLELVSPYSVIATSPTTGTAHGVEIVGTRAYVADGAFGLHVIDMTETSPYPLEGSVVTPGYAFHVDVDGAYAYVADSTEGLQIVDISTPATPVIVGARDTPGEAKKVAVSGKYAYVADAYSGLHAIDVSRPIFPIDGAQTGIAGAGCVAISGPRAYVGGDDGLLVVDLSNPALPIIGSREIPGDEEESGSYAVRGIAVAGDLVFAAAEEAGLVVIDASDPTYPIVGTADTLGWAGDVAISGSYAFVADQDTGMQIVDVSDPTYPIIATVDTSGEESGVTISGNYAYLATWGDLVIVDISDPQFPVVGSIPTGGNSYRVAVRGDRAYVAETDNGIRVVDVSDPADPSVIGFTPIPDAPWSATDVMLVGGYALVANRGEGVQILDISDPDNPSPPIVETRDTPVDAWEIAISGRYAYVADGNGGLQVIDLLGQ